MFWKKPLLPQVSFATCVWERDWRQILLSPDYLPICQIERHGYPFAEKILIINNVIDVSAVKNAALYWVKQKVLDRIIIANEVADEVFSFFALRKSDFQTNDSALSCDWLYYNALGPLSAIWAAKSSYLLYLTGDVRLDAPLNWVRPSLKMMEANENFRVANPVWNKKYDEARREAQRKKGAFFIAAEGFSDQLFLVRTRDFQAPIYGEIREDAAHFPRGDVFEKRVFSYMKNRGWERIVFRRGSYTHENF